MSTHTDPLPDERDVEFDGPPPTDPSEKKSPWRFVKWAAIAVLAALALMYGAIWFYANVLNDAPDALDENDLSEALVEETATPAEAAQPSAAPANDNVLTAPAGFDGLWVPTRASEFGYRVDEVISGVDVTAVGRSNEIDGSLSIDGTTANIDVAVEVANIQSDDARRDGQFRGRIMDAATFPTATFVTTQPIEFGAIPAAGEQVIATATGDLTLRGETRSVTFDVTAETVDGRIGVLGNIPIVFADYGIPEPSFGPISVEDNGLLEFVLVFEQA